MDVGEEMVLPLADIELRQFVASHEDVYDGCVIGCIVVAADEILNRIIHTATRFELHGESLRKNV